MAFNGSGTYSAPASSWNPAVTNTAINSTDWAALLADLSTALSTTLCKDGQSIPTANLPMGGFKLTGLAAGSASGNSVRYEQVFLLNGTNAGDLLFTDATYDIGKSGATRPRDVFLSRNLTVGGTAAVTGHVTLEGVTSTGATGTGKLVFDTSPTIATAALGSSTATTQAAADNSTKLATTAYVDRGASGASWVLIQNQAASNSATVDFTTGIDGTYSEYVFVLSDILCATDAQQFNLRVTQDSGSTFKAGATDYNWNSFSAVDGAAVATASGNTTVIALGTALSNTKAFSSWVTLSNPSNTSRGKIFNINSAYSPSGATLYRWIGMGILTLNTAAINGVRFFVGAGNITSGNIALYGLRKS